MEILNIILISAVLLAIAIFALSVQIIFKKTHKFPHIHVGGNRNMKKLGITCAQTWDKIEQNKVKKELQFKNLTLAEKQ